MEEEEEESETWWSASLREREKAFHYSTCGGGVKIVSGEREEHLRNRPHLSWDEVLHCDVGSGDSSADGLI